MVDISGFDATKVEPQQQYDTIPVGPHIAIIQSQERVATKAKDGHLLKLTVQIVEGPAKGRLVWSNLNLWNKDSDTKLRAGKEMSSICRAIGVMQPKDTREFVGKPLIIVTTNKEYNGELQAKIKEWKPVSAGLGKDKPANQDGYSETIGPAPANNTESEKAPWEE